MGESAYHDLPAESQRGNPLRSACTAWYCPHGPKKSIAAALIYCRPSGSLQAALYLYRSGYFPVSLMFFPNCIQLQILEDQITYTHLPIDPATQHSTAHIKHLKHNPRTTTTERSWLPTKSTTSSKSTSPTSNPPLSASQLTFKRVPTRSTSSIASRLTHPRDVS